MAAPRIDPPGMIDQEGRTRCLVLLVPGMAVAEPGLYLGKLTAGLKEFARNRDLRIEESNATSSSERTRLIAHANESTTELELAESYWSDLRPRLSAESGVKKLFGGLSLLWFWLASPKVWAQSTRSKWMLLNALGSLSLIVVWYYAAVVTLLSAADESPWLLELFGLGELAPRIAKLGASLGGANVLMIAGAFTALLPMLVVVDVSHATRSYLQNRDGFASKVKARVEKVLYAALKEDFDHIVVVAHSFGVAVATEVLSELDQKPKSRLSLVTLGGSLGLLRAASPRADEAYHRLLESDLLSSWSDFWSDEDWLGTPALESSANGRDGFGSRPLDATVSLPDKLSGKSHGLYFTESDVYETLLLRCSAAKLAPAGAGV